LRAEGGLRIEVDKEGISRIEKKLWTVCRKDRNKFGVAK